MQPQKNIRVENGRLFTEVSGWMRHWRDGVMGGDVRCGDLEWKQQTMALASLLFFFFSPPPPPPRPAAVITQPNPLGGLSRLKSRKIVQLSGLWAGEGVGRAECGRWGEHWDCVLLERVVFILHNSLSQGYFGHARLMTEITEKLEERQALICCLSL